MDKIEDHRPKRLVEILRMAEQRGLTREELRVAQCEFYHGAESFDGAPLPGIAGAFSYLIQKEDAGIVRLSSYVRRVLEKKEVVWPVVSYAQKLNTPESRAE